MRRPSFLFLAPFLTRLGLRGGFNAHFLARQSFTVTTSYVIGALKGIITGYLVTRLFPPELYGAYKFALSIVGTIGFMTIPGIVSTLGTLIAKKQKDAPVRSAIILYAIWCCVGSLFIAGSIVFLPYWHKESLWLLLVIASLLFVPSTIGVHIFSALVRGTGRFDHALKASLMSNSFQVVGVLLVLWLRPSSILLLLCTSGIPSIVYASYVWWWSRQFTSHSSFRPAVWQSISLSIVSVPTTLSWYIDGLLVTAYFGLNQLAVLSVALLIPEQLKLWSKELFPILYASQAKGVDSWERRRKISRLAGLGTIFFVVGIALFCMITPFIIPILFPYYDAREITFLTNIAACTLINTPSTLCTQYMEARGMIRELQWCTWLSSFFYVITLCILVPMYGPVGAILSRGMLRISLALMSHVALYIIPIKQ